MKILSLNVKKYTSIDRLRNTFCLDGFDVIVLQEFITEFRSGSRVNTNKKAHELKEYLVTNGYRFELSDSDNNGNTVLVAAKNSSTDFSVLSRRERWLEIEYNNIKILAIHIPCIDKDIQRKICFWNDVIRYAVKEKDSKAVIIGDYNEYLERDNKDNKESLLSHNLIILKSLGWIDIWEVSDNRKGDVYTWKDKRLDYAFISPSLEKSLVYTDYLHDVRQKGLSDHSALVVEIDLSKI